jgi:hypothetical protein
MPRIRDPRDAGIYTADMGQPPDEPDMGSAPAPRPMGRSPQTQRTLRDLMNKRAPLKTPRPRGIRGGVWTEDSGLPPPMEPDGGSARPFKEGGSVSSASKRADGIAQRGKTRGKYL